jgi:endonuclease YncB( thermonuclease family)
LRRFSLKRARQTASVAIAISLSLIGVAFAQGQAGPLPVRLSDGDSFVLGNERYRLYGIDAPELHQQCTDAAGKSWPCGMRARSELRRIIGTSPLQCRKLSVDRYGRHIAVCHAQGRDIAAEMVRAGFAITLEGRGRARTYEDAQADARAAKRGIWAGHFDPPNAWRRANPRDSDAGQRAETPLEWLQRKAISLWQLLESWLRSLFSR